MEAAAVAALAALAGVALGRFLDVWAETRKWLRERRSDAYGAFLGAAERYLSGVIVAHGDPAYRISSQGMELDRIYGDLELFGSEDSYVAARRVRDALEQLHKIHRELSPNDDSVDDVYADDASPIINLYHHEIEVFRIAAKKELRVH